VLQSPGAPAQPARVPTPPRRSSQGMAALVRQLHRYGVTPTINMLIYQDGRIAPRSLASLQETRALLDRE
jgi:hypothetical protein